VTSAELEAELAQGRLRPAYLLVGEEALLRDDALAALRRAVLGLDDDARAGDARAEFDHDVLEGERTDPGALVDALGTLPVLAERRLVELREPTARRGGGAAGLLDALAGLLGALEPSSPVVLVVACARADRRARWVRAFSEPHAVVDCQAPRRSREVVRFVQSEARRQGVRLGAGAAELLAERIGPQLLVLRQEIAKAALWTEPGGTVERSQVAASASQLAEEPVWDLTDAIGEGRAGDALAVLHRILAQGAPPPVVLGVLAGHVRKLVRVRAGERVPGPLFVVRKLESQARRYRGARLLAGLRAIHEADEVLKGRGQLPPELALERLVLGLAA